MELVTPITPAAVLGHVDARPRRVNVREGGWYPSDVARVLVGSLPYGQVKARLRDGLEWVRRLRAADGLFAPHGGEYAQKFGCLETDAIVAHIQAAEQLAEAGLLRELEALETAGDLAISVSAYNADSDCAVVYWHGKPIGQM